MDTYEKLVIAGLGFICFSMLVLLFQMAELISRSGY
jgi:hypothetical protein